LTLYLQKAESSARQSLFAITPGKNKGREQSCSAQFLR
jgi:hypothetical protein